MRTDPRIEFVLPFLLSEAHAHRYLVVELDGVVRHEWCGTPGRVPAWRPTRKPAIGPHTIATSIFPEARSCSTTCAGRFSRISALRRVDDCAIEHLVAQQPISAGRSTEDADPQRAPRLRRQLQSDHPRSARRPGPCAMETPARTWIAYRAGSWPSARIPLARR